MICVATATARSRSFWSLASFKIASAVPVGSEQAYPRCRPFSADSHLVQRLHMNG